jgi:hypothetical protein
MGQTQYFQASLQLVAEVAQQVSLEIRMVTQEAPVVVALALAAQVGLEQPAKDLQVELAPVVLMVLVAVGPRRPRLAELVVMA